MKKRLIIITVICIFLIGCNNESVENTNFDNGEVIQLKDELESQEKDIQSKDEELALKILQIEELEKKVEELALDIEHTKKQVILGKGYAMQFMYDLEEVYNYIHNSQLSTSDDKASKVIDKLIKELSKSEIYSNKKIVSIKIKEGDEKKEENYTFEVLMFTPIKQDQLSDSIDNYTSPQFPAIILYSTHTPLNVLDFNVQ